MQVALITGGNRGIGRSIALHSVKKGIGVVITYNNGEKEAIELLNEIKSLGGKAHALKLDVSNYKNIEPFAVQLKKVLKEEFNRENFDVLINNAGIAGKRGAILDTTEEAFDEVVNVNLKGPFFLTQKLVPIIIDGGQIINISSGLARFTFPGVAVYGALKSALEGFTRYFAREFANRNIRTNTIAPGPVDTEFGGGKDPNAVKIMSDLTALNRIANADDIGSFVAEFIASGNQFITAQRIEISGGMFI